MGDMAFTTFNICLFRKKLEYFFFKSDSSRYINCNFLGICLFKTKNIWIVTWLHYFYNLFSLTLSDYLAKDVESVEKFVVSSIACLVCFLPLLKSKIFRDSAILEDMFIS